MLIDFHTHCFPDAIAARALSRLSFAAGGLAYHNDATVGGLRRAMRDQGVDAAVILNIATNAHQMRSVNDFAASVNDDRAIFAFGSVYPFAPDALDELERIRALGLKGVKFHPDYQNFFVDDPRMKPVYRRISQLGLITVFHAGFDYGYPQPYHCLPAQLRRALEWFDAPVVAAHWGGLDASDDVLSLLCGQPLYFDTAFGYGHIPRPAAEKILERHGVDRILFATDAPWQTPEMQMRLLNTLGLDAASMEKIRHGNAERLLRAD